ncbi:hypothetical protein T4B_10247 [Trichinella pseudospiralis]|uniref:Uncharacterized protein n=1 Tax=Trichinella pseudospiralis TaxID=6337 RepID=A0A0V1H157_TRIPS|nr:hypothetical protein T4B_10247 [Trichinella pseudospiralis]
MFTVFYRLHFNASALTLLNRRTESEATDKCDFIEYCDLLLISCKFRLSITAHFTVKILLVVVCEAELGYHELFRLFQTENWALLETIFPDQTVISSTTRLSSFSGMPSSASLLKSFIFNVITNTNNIEG